MDGDGETAWKIGIYWLFLGVENFLENELRLNSFFSLFDFQDLKFVRDVFIGEVCESN